MEKMSDFISKLTERQVRFVRHYINLGNATESAKRAGYSSRSAMEIGYQLLQKTSVQEAIAELSSETLSRLDVTKERILTELARVGLSNMKDLAEWHDGSLTFKSSEDLEEDKSAAISEISNKKGNTDEMKIKTHDKVKALTKLGDFLGMEKGGVVDGKEKSNEIKLAYPLVRPEEESEGEDKPEGAS